MVAIPSPPVLGYSFTGLTVSNPNALLPGNFLDQEYNRAFNCLDDIIAVLHVSLNADGTLNGTAANAILTAAVAAATALNPTGAVALETARALSAEGLNTTAITAEVAARAAAVTAEVAARNTAIGVETTARTTAVTAETTRATTAEALLAPKASPAFTGGAAVVGTTTITGPASTNATLALKVQNLAGSIGLAVDDAARVILTSTPANTSVNPANMFMDGAGIVYLATPSLLASATGYIRLPGGITLQWGNATSAVGVTTVTFPVSFSSTVWAILALPKDASNAGPASPVALETTTVYTNAGFNLFTFDTTTGAFVAANFFWFAVGPT